MPHLHYKLAVWDARFICFRDTRPAYANPDLAKAAAKKPGRYRVSEVGEAGRKDLEPFDVTGEPAGTKAPRTKFAPHASRPMGGRPH